MMSRWSLSLALVLLAFISCLTACANSAKQARPPISLPFQVGKAGSLVEAKVGIVEHREYIFSLRFGYKKNDPSDRARVKKLVGDDGQVKGGDPGIPTPLRLKISVIDSRGERSITEQDIPELRLRSWGSDHFNKHIAYVILKPGHYRVSVESLKDAPELLGTPTAFAIGFYAKATPITH